MSKRRQRNIGAPVEPPSAAAGGAEVYLVRHAIAAERGLEWPDDDLRPLTNRGILRFKEGVAGLVALDVVIDQVLTSPLVRARQTADLLASGLAGHPPVSVIEALAPGHAAARVMEQVAGAVRGRRVAIVGHEPGLGELAAFLIGSRQAIPFRKGGVCRIDVETVASRVTGALVWLATPRILRGLAE